jgi:hypothetical protein
MRYAAVLAIVLLSIPVYGSGDEELPEDLPEFGPLLRSLMENIDHPWAKPLLDADMELIESLLDTGFLSDTEADWYVPLTGDTDGQ